MVLGKSQSCWVSVYQSTKWKNNSRLSALILSFDLSNSERLKPMFQAAFQMPSLQGRAKISNLALWPQFSDRPRAEKAAPRSQSSSLSWGERKTEGPLITREGERGERMLHGFLRSPACSPHAWPSCPHHWPPLGRQGRRSVSRYLFLMAIRNEYIMTIQRWYQRLSWKTMGKCLNIKWKKQNTMLSIKLNTRLPPTHT